MKVGGGGSSEGVCVKVGVGGSSEGGGDRG